MSIHSYSNIWIHFIWSTLGREPVLNEQARRRVSGYFFNYCKEKQIYIKTNFVNADHVHLLLDLPTSLSIEECVKLIKGSSSHFINQDRLTSDKFNWGRGYGAFSVSESLTLKVAEYIQNQEEHHRKKSFADEIELFLQKHGRGDLRNN